MPRATRADHDCFAWAPDGTGTVLARRGPAPPGAAARPGGRGEAVESLGLPSCPLLPFFSSLSTRVWPPYPYVLFLFCLVAFLDACVLLFVCVVCLFGSCASTPAHGLVPKPAWAAPLRGSSADSGRSTPRRGCAPPFKNALLGVISQLGIRRVCVCPVLYRKVGNGARLASTVGRRLEFGLSELRF